MKETVTYGKKKKNRGLAGQVKAACIELCDWVCVCVRALSGFHGNRPFLMPAPAQSLRRGSSLLFLLLLSVSLLDTTSLFLTARKYLLWNSLFSRVCTLTRRNTATAPYIWRDALTTFVAALIIMCLVLPTAINAQWQKKVQQLPWPDKLLFRCLGWEYLLSSGQNFAYDYFFFTCYYRISFSLQNALWVHSQSYSSNNHLIGF